MYIIRQKGGFTMKIVLLLIFLVSNLFAEAQKKEENKEEEKEKTQVVKVIQANYKSELDGFMLGSGLGFGIGHYYAENSEVYTWLGADTLLLILSVVIPSQTDASNRMRYAPLIALGIERVFQGVNAMGAVRKYNALQQGKEPTEINYSLVPIKSGAVGALSFNF